MKTVVWNEKQIYVFSFNVKQSPLGILRKERLDSQIKSLYKTVQLANI